LAIRDFFKLSLPSIFNPKPKKQNPFKTYGATGTQFFSGFISNEEYLDELTGVNAIGVYDKMRRNDAQIRGTLYAVMLPIRQAKWYIEPASEKPEDIEIAQRIQDNLFNEMSITWDDFLRQSLNYLTFGYSVFEKVFKLYDDGKIMLRKLAPRQQATIYRWYNDKDDNFAGIQQYVQRGDSGDYDYIDIWREKLVVFTNDQEGNNYEGISVLRSAYKHWYIKDKLYKIDAIGHDRWASGIPVMTEPENVNDGDRARVATILKNLHSREKSYIHNPHGWEFDIKEKSGSNDSIIKSIQHHNEEISKNILAQFINLGTTSSGSRSLGESFEELFMQSLNAIGAYITDKMNRFVIKQLVDMNWKVKDYPKLKHNRIVLNTGRWLESMSKIGLSQAITRDNAIEQVMREALGLPKLSEETIKERQEITDHAKKDLLPDDEKEVKPKKDNKVTPDKAQPDDKGKAAILSPDSIQLNDRERMRELSDIEKQICNFDEVEAALNTGSDKYIKQILKIKKQQAEYLSKALLTQTADEIQMPFIEKLADRLYKEQQRQMQKGKRHLREEFARQKEIGKIKELKDPELLEDDDFQDQDNVDDFLKDKAKADAEVISNSTLGTGLFFLYNIPADEENKSEFLFDSIMGSGNTTLAGIAAASSNKAYGLGREVQAGVYGEQINYAVYSAVLDGNTCENCLPKDGVKHAADDPNFQAPNPSCQGGSRCRCINIYATDDLEITQELRSPADWKREKTLINSGKISTKDVLKKRREFK